jgi:hypothetical protein
MNESPTWIDEFGEEYDIPNEILHIEGIEDHSWHNDTCPSFGLYDSLGTFLRIWVEHPDPDQREFASGSRFGVMFSDDDDHDRCNGEMLYDGDDVDDAVRVFMTEGLAEYHATTRAKMGA